MLQVVKLKKKHLVVISAKDLPRCFLVCASLPHIQKGPSLAFAFFGLLYVVSTVKWMQREEEEEPDQVCLMESEPQ